MKLDDYTVKERDSILVKTSLHWAQAVMKT